eukprot:CAMPEP_0168363142 /NCGR_PEP_ID=MMETSP0228-20121227/3540_1 /TAXON_ID=133427 /ORGANISM="Protoceratium reticulatum, Strain CCCM 535 (=CCMP 1889)" /LENGTH=418 /DNA_ID=CAMNT_0008375863 /DNA_START=29 /DNA_END=1283 /DNA_ORIENTATION=+
MVATSTSTTLCMLSMVPGGGVLSDSPGIHDNPGPAAACLASACSDFEPAPDAAAKNFGYVVEYAYSLRICQLHVAIERFMQRCFSRRPYHSRFADLRSEFPLGPRGACFVHPVPCMTNNLAYLVVDGSAGAVDAAAERLCGLPCCLVDPCDAAAVVECAELLAEGTYAEFGGLALEAVLCTHKHWDHAGGNRDISALARAAPAAHSSDVAEGAAWPGPHLRYNAELPVYGGYDEAMPGRTHPLESGEKVWVGGLELEALATPGHTVGSTAFCIKNLATAATGTHGVGDVIFTGDCLFSGGCGAPFEGSNLDMEHCYATILQRCDLQKTSIFPGHEYTMMLLETELRDSHDSSLEVPPGHFLSLCGDLYSVAHRRKLHDKLPTVPCTLAGEQQVNPMFWAVRWRAQALLRALEAPGCLP